ncbi:MAG: DUF368 domain-containing protein [Treponema sp.]|nr:DUF368 domain-containing protein [Treponema sp.]
MEHIKLFIKGLFIGIGGVAPGLSGGIIMISLGLYNKTIDYIATLYKDFIKKMVFLVPIISGMMISAVFFSRVIDSLLKQYEIQTRLAFFGMLLGTIPLFFGEVKRNGILRAKHYILMVPSFLLGLGLLFLGNTTSASETITIPISFLLGFFGLALTIIPGFNWATFFSAIGIYGHWLTLMSFRPENFTLAIYAPAITGALIGLFTVSKAVSFLLSSDYTTTMSILFGFFIAVIPGIIFDTSDNIEGLSLGPPVYIGLVLFIIGFFIAYWFGKLSKPKVL